MGSPELTIMAHPATLVAFCALALILAPAMSKPWYQGDGLPDCAPGKCPAQPRSPPSSAAQTWPCSSTTDTPRTVLKARSVTPLPLMLPKEIRADLLLEERVMRGNEVFVKNETVSKINLNTFLPLKMASQMPVALRIVVHC